MANIKDVAKLAGVSVSTVSNIINDKTTVSGELYQRVTKAMQELNYHPNMLAMNLKKSKVNFIGIIINQLSGHYHQILEGIYRELDKQKSQPIVKIIGGSSAEKGAIDSLLRLGVTGIIVISSNLNDELVKQYKDTRVPIVFADLYPAHSDMNVVCFDNGRIVKELTKKLIEKSGDVALISGNSFLGSENNCINGFLDAGGKREQLLETTLDKERSYSEIMDFIEGKKTPPRYYIVSNEYLGTNLNDICKYLNISDYRIFALAGDSWYTENEHKLTYVARDAITCGTEAVKLLMENIDESVTFDTQKNTIGYFGDISNLVDNGKHFVMPKVESKSINLLMLESKVSEAVKRLCKDFTVRTGINVSIHTKTQQELKRIILENAGKKNREYDIIMADLQWSSQLIKEKVFCKLNDLMDLSEIKSRYIHDFRSFALESSEDVFALPVLVGSQLLVYKADIFDDAYMKKKYYLQCGIPLEPPQNWNEYNLVAKFFTQEYNADSPVKYGNCLLGNNEEGMMAEFLPRFWSFGGKNGDDGILQIDSMAGIKTVRNICEAYEYSYPECRYFLEDEQIAEFLKGDIAMISTYNVHLPKELDYLDKRIGFSNLPGKASVIGGWFIGVSAYSQKVEESIKFLEWELSNRISIRSSLFGQVSPFKKVFYDSELLKLYPWMDVVNMRKVEPKKKELIIGKNILDKQPVGMNKSIESIISELIWGAINGTISPEEAVKYAQEQIMSV